MDLSIFAPDYDDFNVTTPYNDLPSVQLTSAASDLCPVCIGEYGNMQVLVLVCGHQFHGGCITPWLLSHHTCPMCRRFV